MLAKNLKFHLDKMQVERVTDFRNYLANDVSPVLFSLRAAPMGSPVRDLGGHMNVWARSRMNRDYGLSMSQSICDWYGLEAIHFYHLHMAQGHTYKIKKPAFDRLHHMKRMAIADLVLGMLLEHGETNWYGACKSVIGLANLSDYVEWGRLGVEA